MKWTGGKQFEQAPAGSQIGRCYAVIDLGTQQHSFEGKTWGSRDVRLSFELPLKKMTGKFDPEDKGRVFSVHATIKQSLHPKATLRKLLEGWRGRKFKDKAEIDKFDPRKLIGLPCRLALVANGEYTNIDGISPLDPDETKKVPKQVNAGVFFSLEPDEFDEEVFKDLHENTQNKIKASPEYAKLGGGGGEPESQVAGSEPDPGAEEGVDAPF